MGARSRVAALAATAGLGLSGCAGPTPPPLPPAAPTAPGAAAAGSPSAAATSAAARPALPIDGSTRSPIEWFVTPTGDPRKDAVLLVIQEYFSMSYRLFDRPNPNDPLIPGLTIDPWRSYLTGAVGRLAERGLSQRGPLRIQITNLTIAGARAQANACDDTTTSLTHETNGQIIGRGSFGWYLVSLQNVGGNWKVANITSPPPDCTINQ